MSYKTTRFKDGLSGKKPGNIYIDETGHQAQESGYREYLKNRDLAEQLRSQHCEDEQSESDPGSAASPFLPWQRVFWSCVGLFLIYLDFLISRAFARSTVANGAGTYGVLLIVSMVLVPGGILGWPGLILIGVALDRN